MIHLKIQGEIIHYFDVKHQYSSIHESISFPKQKILIESEGQQYTLSFLKEKIKLLKFCKLGTVVEASVALKGRMWTFKNKEYSVNELVCSSLKIVKNTILKDFVRFKGNIYNIQRRYDDDQLVFNLVSIENNSQYILSINHVFPDKSINKDHVLIMDTVDKELLNHLEELGILSIGTWKQTAEGVSGIICKILVLDLFEYGELLFTKAQEKEALRKDQNDKTPNQDRIDFDHNYSSRYDDYEEDYFNAMTDGQMGDYDDFRDGGGNIDDIDTWSRG